MFYEQDWVMRQIKMVLEFVTRAVFHKDIADYVIEDESCKTETRGLSEKLNALLRDGKICEAEDLLFENRDDSSRDFLALALNFYQKLNRMSDEELQRGNFSRDEIQEGLRDILKGRSDVPQLPFFEETK